MTRLFGTDGVRGLANTELRASLAFALGQAAVEFLGRHIVIGKDTRRSGDMLEAAVAAGVMSVGGVAHLAGVIPTPAVAFLVRKLKAAGGIVISASHNPPEYNGIKFFDREGFKLADGLEDEIEHFVQAGGTTDVDLCSGDAVGYSRCIPDAAEHYIAHAVATLQAQDIDLSGLKVALDVGHGASCVTSPEALRRLGAQVICMNEDYNGIDINVECGSTHLEPLRVLVAQTGAAVGIAHDGDADRVMMVDAQGTVVDGDVIEAVCALDLKARGKLSGNTVVSTVMCNLGLVHALRAEGINLIQTQVGDRYVLEAMREGGYVLGGEQSGHLIFLEHNSTGDGLVSALQFLAACKRSGKSVEDMAQVMTRFPQTLVNVEISKGIAAEESEHVQEAILQAEEQLGEQGRVLIRRSGTEPVVRVMVEAADADKAKRHAHHIAAVLRAQVESNSPS